MQRFEIDPEKVRQILESSPKITDYAPYHFGPIQSAVLTYNPVDTSRGEALRSKLQGDHYINFSLKLKGARPYSKPYKRRKQLIKDKLSGMYETSLTDSPSGYTVNWKKVS